MLDKLINFLFEKEQEKTVKVTTIKSENRVLEHFFPARRYTFKRKKSLPTCLNGYFENLSGLNKAERLEAERAENPIIASL